MVTPPGGALSEADEAEAARLARGVTIYRDAYGVPHIHGKTDEHVVFGYAYAQAEDYFWQIEDTYILSLGRYSEVHGQRGLNSDLLNRAFEVVPQLAGHLQPARAGHANVSARHSRWG